VFLTKKVGDFNKKESESLDFTGLKIPRDYRRKKEENANMKVYSRKVKSRRVLEYKVLTPVKDF